MPDFLINLLAQNPQVSAVLSILGLVRLINKPLMTILTNVVKATETKEDDKLLSTFKNSQGYKVFCYLVDWFTSIKIRG